jgi:hypothetical protein
MADMLRCHEQLWMLFALVIATIWMPTLIWLPGSWLGVPVDAMASTALAWVVMRLIP